MRALPNLHQAADGDHLDLHRRRIAALEQQQERLLTQLSAQARDKIKTSDPVRERFVAQATPPDPGDHQLLAQREAEIARSIADYNKRPIRTQLTPSTRVATYAMYYTALQKRIEQTGTRHFPQQDGKKIYGELIVYIPVYQDGSVYEKQGGPRVERSSGNAFLDRAALAIVRRAAPFGAFPPGAIDDDKTHVWEIITRFRFTRDATLETHAVGGAQ